MNNLDKIIEKINLQAKSEADSCLARATADAARIMEEGENRASDILLRAKRQAERETLATVERAYSTADMKKREILLGTRVGLINKTFADAEKKLCSLDTKAYSSFCVKLICDAVCERTRAVERLFAEYGDEEEYSTNFEAVFNENDKKAHGGAIVRGAKTQLKKLFPEGSVPTLRLSENTADISGGVIIRYGDIETNCSVEAVVSEIRSSTETEVFELLFAPKPENGDEGQEL